MPRRGFKLADAPSTVKLFDTSRAPLLDGLFGLPLAMPGASSNRLRIILAVLRQLTHPALIHAPTDLYALRLRSLHRSR